MKPRQTLWILLAERRNPKVAAVAPTLAWAAAARGAHFEMYLESARDGRLFAQTGSTVLGGGHCQQLNYLCASFAVELLILGRHELFASSFALWQTPVLAQAETATELYRVLDLAGPRVILPDAAPAANQPDLRPYCYPELLFRQALGIPAAEAEPGETLLPGSSGSDYRAFTVGLAERWLASARGLAFGDPDAILALLPTLCRERRVAVFGPRQALPPAAVVANAYAEEHSSACADVRRLCERLDNRLILGRQTCDGDLFEWSQAGVAIQIVDPNRPPFPVVATVPQRWARHEPTVYALEPDDATLVRWADSGQRLAALLVHSGEMAHNEAMLNLLELCGTTGLKLGLGVHAARYESCPQLWETLAVAVDRGGTGGLIEPVLHCGGMGVLTESTCPRERLAEHCRTALARIAAICGEAWRPRGYLAFMDSDMSTFTRTMPELYAALGAAGLAYSVSCALPGRNRVLYRDVRHLTLNQGSRTLCTGSPYVRVHTAAELRENSPGPSPGWWLGVIDAPVVAFAPYVWRQGHEFMGIVDALTKGAWINVTPHVVARYARLLAARGQVPEGVPVP